MKVILMACTHCQFPKLPEGKFDLLIHAGDACCFGSKTELEIFNSYLGANRNKFKFKPIFVPDNHDRFCEENPNEAKQVLTNVTMLVNNTVRVGGFNIYGSPYTPEWAGWAFMKDHKGLCFNWELIPAETDITALVKLLAEQLEALPESESVLESIPE